MMYVCLALLLSLLSVFPAYLAGQTAPERPSTETVRVQLDDYFRKAAGLGFSGAVLVAKDGQVLLRNGYGWADHKNRIPITADSVFDIGSNTKVLTAVAVMQLIEKGKVSASDPISKYFSNVPPDKSGITIHHLLTHTAGLAHDDFYSEAKPDVKEVLKSREKFIERILSFPLATKPGESRMYSNSGFSFLAAIVEKVSGQSYENYLLENVLKPAGMTRTGYVVPKWKNDLIARGYNDGNTDYGYPWETQWAGKIIPWDLLGNGGVLSTVDDMYRFLTAFKGEKLLAQKTKDDMLTIRVPDRGQAYGWLFAKTETGERPFILHGGDAVPQGHNADIRLFRDDDLIVVVLSNKRSRAGSLRRYAANHAADIALFGKPPQLPEFNEVKAERFRGLEGVYALDSGATFHVKTDIAATGGGKTTPVLMIGGIGQHAIDLLFSANSLPGLAKLSLELSDKTRAYVEALRKNDLTAVKALLPAEASAEEALKRWNEFVRQNGELENIDVLGTSPLNQTGSQAFLRLRFKNAEGFYHVTWRTPKMHEQDEDIMQPAITLFLRRSFTEFPINLPFLPKTETEFATYDLFKGRTVNVRFTPDEKLIVQTKGGDVTARKIK